MAKNDRILLDGIVDDRVRAGMPSHQRDEVFEYLASEQVLKHFDLSQEEIQSGLIDGRGDGGIDGLFILVNGHLLQDPESFSWPKTSSDLKVMVISSKHHDTFKQSALDAMIATLTEFFDFEIDDGALRGSYSPRLIQMRSNLRFAYRRLSPRLAQFSVDVYYASRGDTSNVGAEVAARGKQIHELITSCFGSCKCSFMFLGSTELVDLHRKTPNYSLELPFVEALAKGERYVLLARLSDYFNFVSDEGKLRRYLFDSNVRDFMGLNRVNDDIRATLDGGSLPDFWWLNNGITILATSASIVGKSIQVTDIQIVNGLQTTESIHRHFIANGKQPDERCILVKIIVSNDVAVRDAITRATNNQTDVELASLHATDRIQRDIEDILLRQGLYYERRKNYYLNLGHNPSEIVAPLYLAAGFACLVLKLPHKAVTLRSRFMRSRESYDLVFSERAPLEVWPPIAQILKRTDAALEQLRPDRSGTERFLKSHRFIVALLLVAKRLGRFTYSASDLSRFDATEIDAENVGSVLAFLGKFGRDGKRSKWSSRSAVIQACTEFAREYGIEGVQVIGTQTLGPTVTRSVQQASASVSEEFIGKVRALLTPQPWKPGAHKRVCETLGCKPNEVFAAVERLVEDEVVYRQRDGVLYDLEGNVKGFDPERVDPTTLELIQDNRGEL